MTDEQEQTIDFSQTIERLELRAKRARRRVLVIGVLLVVSVMLLFSLLTSGILNQSRIAIDVMELKFRDSRSDVESVLERRASMLLEELIGPRYKREEFKSPTKERAVEISKELDEVFSDLEQYRKIKEIGKQDAPVSTSSGISSVIGSAVFSLGAVAFVVLLIQIAVSFMRYHTRLSELYEAQADALRASSGVPSRAISFMEHFSPNSIELGKAPTTLYEKALDTVREVAKKP